MRTAPERDSLTGGGFMFGRWRHVQAMADEGREVAADVRAAAVAHQNAMETLQVGVVALVAIVAAVATWYMVRT